MSNLFLTADRADQADESTGEITPAAVKFCRATSAVTW
jgi:hypothetical protein